MQPIRDIAARLDLTDQDWIPYGHHKAKLDLSLLNRRPSGRLCLVSAITPTTAGEGKTTTSIGLAQGLHRLGHRTLAALREPSLGPCFGMKGGGTGGGRSEVVPTDDINLHFNGDFHAITAAHNLLAAMIDNHLHFQTGLLDPRRVLWRRVLDVNDRALRSVLTGLSGPANGTPREAGFDITAASEVMAALCLARDPADLRARLSRMIVGFSPSGDPVTADQTGAVGSMMVLLKDAMLPNLVQTTEGVPAILHGGPFANIAHGANSVIATRMALGLADWVITEAGFGFDLGGEKFFDLVCPAGELEAAAVVLVATLRALRHHGGIKGGGTTPDPEAVERGLWNLERHVRAVRAFGHNPVIALNRRAPAEENAAEVDALARFCDRLGVNLASSSHFADGGAGAEDLARAVIAAGRDGMRPATPAYEADAPLQEKVRQIAARVYGVREVVWSKTAEKDRKDLQKMGVENLPVCMARNQYAFGDESGGPVSDTLTVRNLQISAGAGFVVVLTGEMMRMPGLPAKPQALQIDLVEGRVVGLR